VTRLKFKLHPLPSFVGGPLVFLPTPEVIAGFTALSAAAPEELSTIGYLMPLPPVPFVPAEMHGKLAFIGMMAYAGDPAGAAEVLAPFRALAAPVADLVRHAPYSSVYDLDPPPEFRPAVAIRSRYLETLSLADAQHILDAMIACDAPMKMAQIRALGGAFGRVPANATAFGHRDAKLMVAFLAMHAPVPAQAAQYARWADDALAALKSRAAGAYVNFLADEGQAGLAAAYPAATWDRLRRVKRQYDPENLFRLNQNIPPAA
jgi:FAD/FMN-containing dehydrogenase